MLYVSLHADPDRAVPVLPRLAPTRPGEGPGAGANLNLPLPAGTTNERTSRRSTAASSAIADHGGSIVVVSLGFDTYGHDPIGDFALTTAGLPRGRPPGRPRSAGGS